MEDKANDMYEKRKRKKVLAEDMLIWVQTTDTASYTSAIFGTHYDVREDVQLSTLFLLL